MSRCRLIFGAGGILSLVALIAPMFVSGCNRGSNAAQMQAPPPPQVTAADVVVRDVPYYVDEIGRCAASESVALTPQVAGRIESANFTEGQDVQKGDVLFTIDPRPFQAAVDQAKAALLQNQENLKLAQIEFSRVEALKGTSAVSQTEYDQKKS